MEASEPNIVSPLIFNTGLTHLGSEASIYHNASDHWVSYPITIISLVKFTFRCKNTEFHLVFHDNINRFLNDKMT